MRMRFLVTVEVTVIVTVMRSYSVEVGNKY